VLKAFLCLIALFSLSGCGGGSGDRTTVTGVCKSCKSYYVRGSWHHPQPHYEYDEVGLASWYGPGFDGKPKPYGEPFDQNAMTAAHKTLPLPTIVRVTDVKTGKSIVVLVDDRGPFVYDGRIIDLSMGAAKALGTYQKGVSKVRVQSLVSESKALADYLARHGNKSGCDKNGRTWLQVYEQEIKGRHGQAVFDGPSVSVPEPAAVPKKIQAVKTPPSIDNLLKQLEKPEAVVPPKAGQPYISVGGDFVQKTNAEKLLKQVQVTSPGKVIETTHPGGQKFYSVRLGPFSDEKKAQDALNRLAVTGQSDAIIVK